MKKTLDMFAAFWRDFHEVFWLIVINSITTGAAAALVTWLILK